MINLDSKADQFVMDENMDYITNRPKKPVETIEPQAVHEGLEVSNKAYPGEINALFDKLMQKLQEQAKKDKYNKEAMELSAYTALISEFTTALTEKVQEDPTVLSASGGAILEEAAGEIEQPMKNMNYSGGPIPVKNYDIPEQETQSEQQQPQQPQQPTAETPDPMQEEGQ